MKQIKLSIVILTFVLTACTTVPTKKNVTFTLAFASCNNQNEENLMWREISKHRPDVFVWGGDIVYADHENDDMDFLGETYEQQKAYPAYKKFIQGTEVIGSWDDHDYGLNDGGVEFLKKAESQKLFLDFLDVAKDSKRRTQKGIYHAKVYQVENHSINVISLDTRYFRTALTIDPDPDREKRYLPNKYGEGTILGKIQWQWLENQLNNSKADFNVINSSIQILSPYHGFEKWQNMPHEVDRLENLIQSSKARNVIILSGDRHISEFSSKQINGLNYPLIDFTSSGINRGLKRDKIEANPYRIGQLTTLDSFGVIRFNFVTKTIVMEIRGKNNQIINRFQQKYL